MTGSLLKLFLTCRLSFLVVKIKISNVTGSHSGSKKVSQVSINQRQVVSQTFVYHQEQQSENCRRWWSEAQQTHSNHFHMFHDPVTSFKWMKIAFIITRKRNNVVVSFGTLEVQSFMLTEVRDCDLLIVVTSSTFLKRKDIIKEKRQLAQIIKARSPAYI